MLVLLLADVTAAAAAAAAATFIQSFVRNVEVYFENLVTTLAR